MLGTCCMAVHGRPRRGAVAQRLVVQLGEAGAEMRLGSMVEVWLEVESMTGSRR
jgi:hypothetical protein